MQTLAVPAWVLAVPYAALCVTGFALDTYSLAVYLLRRRRPMPPPLPLVGLILYVFAALWRLLLDADPLVVRWELLALAGYHVAVHAAVPLALRLGGRPAR